MKDIHATRLVNSLTSKGNSKIGKDTIIFNMTSARDCPSDKLGLCDMSKICYAKKAEVQYPSTLKYRREQTLLWDDITAEQFANAIVEISIKKKIALKYLRFSESGDIRNVQDIAKIVKIAHNLYNAHKADKYLGLINIYLYTKRIDLKEALQLASSECSNLVINGSGFMLDNNYTAADGYAIDKKVVKILNIKNSIILPKKDTVLCNGDCSLCSLCKVKGNKNIIVIKH